MNTDRSEHMRQLIDAAVNFGKKHRNPQTGFVHLCQGAQEHYTIPLIENFLYALALLRTRLVDNVNDAKTLLDNLLHFQNLTLEPSIGNFPIYLHDYPHCKDRFIGIQISTIIFSILKSYHQGLGSELKSRLEKALILSIKHALAANKEKSAKYPTQIKIATTAISAGKLLSVNDLINEGESLLQLILDQGETEDWYCPQSMGKILSALNLIYADLETSPWRNFWSHIKSCWHKNLACYIGPGLKEWQDKGEPQSTFYELYMEYYFGTLSKKALQNNQYLLEAALIGSLESKIDEIVYPYQNNGQFKHSSWMIGSKNNLAYSFIANYPISELAKSSFIPAKFVWATDEGTNTLVFQGGNNNLIAFETRGESIDLLFELGAVVDHEDREKSKELVCFINTHNSLESLISGNKSSTFQISDTIELNDSEIKMNINFAIIEGEGHFFGHRMPGNRPSQLHSKETNGLEAYDWQIALRTVRRSNPCKIKVSLRPECGKTSS